MKIVAEDIKEIVVISGKGGTGKTSIAASFGYLGGDDVIMADCDVDAADLHLLMKPDFGYSEDFYSGELAFIDPDKCTLCGDCAEVCRFDAIALLNGKYSVDALNCEGCGYCARICPAAAISNIKQQVGRFYISSIRTGAKMVHARLNIGADNSGKLVAKVKNEAKRLAAEHGRKTIIIDGSPGVGCPVVSSLSGADLAVLVTEPTKAGLHDLIRIYELVQKFRIKAGCIINKYDLNPAISEEIRKFLRENNISELGAFPYDEKFTMAINQAKTIVEYDSSGLGALIDESWRKTDQMIK